jgi:hypothetical protein
MRNVTSTNGGARVPRRSGMAGLFVVPKLEEVAGDGGTVEMLDAHTTVVLETTAIAALSALRKRKLTLAAEARTVSQARRPDRADEGEKSSRAARCWRRLGLPQSAQTSVSSAARHGTPFFLSTVFTNSSESVKALEISRRCR